MTTAAHLRLAATMRHPGRCPDCDGPTRLIVDRTRGEPRLSEVCEDCPGLRRTVEPCRVAAVLGDATDARRRCPVQDARWWLLAVDRGEEPAEPWSAWVGRMAGRLDLPATTAALVCGRAAGEHARGTA